MKASVQAKVNKMVSQGGKTHLKQDIRMARTSIQTRRKRIILQWLVDRLDGKYTLESRMHVREPSHDDGPCDRSLVVAVIW